MPVPEKVRRINIEAAVTGGETLVHTLHCWVRDPILAGVTIQDQANFIRDAWGPQFLTRTGGGFGQYIATKVQYQKVTVYALQSNGQSSESAEALFSPAIGGTSVNHLQLSAALVCSMRTARVGRSYRGRLYLGGLSNLAIDSTTGRVTAGVRNTAATAMAGFLSHLNGQGTPPTGVPHVKMGVLSVKRGEITPITQVVVDDLFDVQTRRQDSLVGAKMAAAVTNL